MIIRKPTCLTYLYIIEITSQTLNLPFLLHRQYCVRVWLGTTASRFQKHVVAVQHMTSRYDHLVSWPRKSIYHCIFIYSDFEICHGQIYLHINKIIVCSLPFIFSSFLFSRSFYLYRLSFLSCLRLRLPLPP